MYIFFLFQILFQYRLLQDIQFPVLYSRSLSIYFIYRSVYLLIPNPLFIPAPDFSFDSHKFVFYVCESI